MPFLKRDNAHHCGNANVRGSHKYYQACQPGQALGTALIFAAGQGHAAMVRLLVFAGARTEDAEPRFCMTPFGIATHRGHVEVVRILLLAGADHSMAHAPCANATKELAIMSLLAGADPNIADPTIFRGYKNITALSVAAWRGHEAIAKLLLAAGAGIDAQTNKAARKGGHDSIFKLLETHQQLLK